MQPGGLEQPKRRQSRDVVRPSVVRYPELFDLGVPSVPRPRRTMEKWLSPALPEAVVRVRSVRDLSLDRHLLIESPPRERAKRRPPPWLSVARSWLNYRMRHIMFVERRSSRELRRIKSPTLKCCWQGQPGWCPLLWFVVLLWTVAREEEKRDKRPCDTNTPSLRSKYPH